LLSTRSFDAIEMKMLDDIRVLDLTHIWFGPWCTMMLAEMGAEVIRVEPPWGAIGRLADGAIFGGASYTFHHLNLNKKDITLDLKKPEGVKIFKELAKKSDVVTQNFSHGTMERLGLGYDVLKELNPRVIYAALSGFGPNGPYMKRKSYAAIVEAMSGHTRLTGEMHDENGPPIQMAQAYGDLAPGTMAAMAIIAALRYRDRTGVGQMIDVAQFDCMVAYNTAITGYTLSGLLPLELKKKYPMGRGVGGLMKCKDGGWIQFAAYGPRFLDSLTLYWSVEEVTEELVKKKTAEMNRDEAVEFYNNLGLPCAPVYHINETVVDPHLEARDMFVEVDHPIIGKVKVPNFPVKFSETPGVVKTSAPLLGQHSKEILMDILGYSEERVIELVRDGVTSLA
jgi:CoA:oxalate CoA-transferase